MSSSTAVRSTCSATSWPTRMPKPFTWRSEHPEAGPKRPERLRDRRGRSRISGPFPAAWQALRNFRSGSEFPAAVPKRAEPLRNAGSRSEAPRDGSEPFRAVPRISQPVRRSWSRSEISREAASSSRRFRGLGNHSEHPGDPRKPSRSPPLLRSRSESFAAAPSARKSF